jgi:hypothetical protein
VGYCVGYKETNFLFIIVSGAQGVTCLMKLIKVIRIFVPTVSTKSVELEEG